MTSASRETNWSTCSRTRAIRIDPATAPAAAEAALLTDLHRRVAEVLRRERVEVEATANVLGFDSHADPMTQVVEAADFAQEHGLRRLWDALRALRTLGVTADAVRQWTRIIDPTVTTGRDEIAARPAQLAQVAIQRRRLASGRPASL